MEILKEYMVNSEITLLDKVKIQAQVLVPLLRALRTELGEARANELVRTTLRDWSRQLIRGLGDKFAGSPKEKWEGLMGVMAPKGNESVELDELRHDEESWDINITSCRYAEFFKSLHEPELGALLTCDMDWDLTEVGAPAVELRRTQTIMNGASYCDFRFTMKKGAA